MKLVIYIILFFLLALYICRYSKYIGENFTETNYAEPDLGTLENINTNIKKSIYIEGNSDLVPGFDKNNIDLYSNKPWDIKNSGFSDIFNYTDNGGFEVYQRATLLDEDNPNFIQDFILGSKVNKETVDPKQPVKFPDTFEYKNEVYKRLGRASNPYYNQYYIIYEFNVPSSKTNTLLSEETKYLNSQLYKYLLIQMDKDTPRVIHATGPRNRVNINDVIYFSLGNFQLGPIKIEN